MLHLFGALSDLALLVTPLFGGFVFSRIAARFLSIGSGYPRRIAIFILFSCAAVLPTWVGDANPLFLLPPFFIVFLLCFSGPLCARTVMCMVLYELLVSWNMIVDSSHRWLEIKWVRYELATRILKVAVWTAIYFFVRKLVRHNGPVRLSKRLWLLVGVLALAPLFAALSFSIWGVTLMYNQAFNRSILRLAYTILPFVFLSSLALLFALTLLARHEELEQEHRLSQLHETYYQGLRREQEQVRALRHDMRNHLTALNGLLAQGDIARAQAYLGELACLPALHGGQRFCENETANTVLSSKALAIRQAGIHADYHIFLPAVLPVSNPDLCALLGNALDNAMEAAAQTREKQIAVRARAAKGLLMLRVENSSPDRSTCHGRFETTKPDKRAHGFGLKGMEEIAARYHGALETSLENGRFTLIACLSISDAE